MRIVLDGTEEEYRKLCSILYDTHQPTLLNMAQEIEDQLEPNADRAFDFITLDEVIL